MLWQYLVFVNKCPFIFLGFIRKSLYCSGSLFSCMIYSRIDFISVSCHRFAFLYDRICAFFIFQNSFVLNIWYYVVWFIAKNNTEFLLACSYLKHLNVGCWGVVKFRYIDIEKISKALTISKTCKSRKVWKCILVNTLNHKQQKKNKVARK